MIVKIKLSEIMGRKRITQKKLSEATGIRPGTINSLYHEFAKQIRIDHLAKICAVLECQPGDLLEYIPEENSEV